MEVEDRALRPTFGQVLSLVTSRGIPARAPPGSSPRDTPGRTGSTSARSGSSTSTERGRAGAERHAIPWRSFWDSGEGGDGGDGPIAAAWGIQAWPTIYVIDDQGVIRHNDLRGDALDAPLARLIEGAERRAAAKR